MIENAVEWRKHLLEQFQKTVQVSDRIGYGARIGYVELGKGFDRIRTWHLGKVAKRKATLAELGSDRIEENGSDREGRIGSKRTNRIGNTKANQSRSTKADRIGAYEGEHEDGSKARTKRTRPDPKGSTDPTRRRRSS